MLATGIAVTSLVAVALTATVAAAPRATVPTWRGTVDLAVSASHPADPEYSFDGPDSFTYSARAVFNGRRSPKGTEGPGWRGTLTWTFRGVANAGTRNECTASGSGAYPVDVLIYRTGGDGDPIRLGVLFHPAPGLGVPRSAAGMLDVLCGSYVDSVSAFENLTVWPSQLSLPPRTKSFSRAIRPRARWGIEDLVLDAQGTGRMSFARR
jgi:hypothetical protein